MRKRHIGPAALALAMALALPLAHAHDVRAGDLRIDHPYATPTRPGLSTGAVYFRGIRNTGQAADRLLSARTPAAARVEIHRMQMDGEVMKMRAVPALELPPGATVPLRHGSSDGHHLMLLELSAPLKDGDRFPVRLNFERAGEHEVMVWVQTPRDQARQGAHPGTGHDQH